MMLTRFTLLPFFVQDLWLMASNVYQERWKVLIWNVTQEDSILIEQILLTLLSNFVEGG